MWNFPTEQFPKSVLAATLGPLANTSRSAGSSLQPPAPQKLPLGKLNIWKVATSEIVGREVALVNLYLGNTQTPLLIRLPTISTELKFSVNLSGVTGYV